MSIIESIIYGFVSGLAEFLPVSSRAHQVLLRYIFGVDSRNFVQEFLVHMGILFSVIIGCRDVLGRLRREQSFAASARHRKKQKLDATSFYDLRLLKTAIVPMIIGLFLLFITIKSEDSLLSIMSLLIVNALVLLLAEHTQHGNRDARTMSGLDGIIMGILGSLCVFPGLSRTGLISAYTTLRGADFKNVTNWAFLLGIPAMIFFIIFDVVGIVTAGAGIVSFSVFVGYILSGIAAFCGGYFAVSIFCIVLNHSGFSFFYYYSFGIALITFLLYLIN